MAQLWDKAGFVGHLHSVLDDSMFDAADSEAALGLLNAAVHRGESEFLAGRYDCAAHHLSLAVAILLEKDLIKRPAALPTVQMLAEGLHRSGQLSYAFTAHVLLTELGSVAGSDAEADKLEQLWRMAEIAGEAERDHPTRFEDAVQLREEALDVLTARSMRNGDTLSGLKYGYELLKHQVRTHGEHHVEVTLTAANLSTACLDLGLYRSAARFARQAVSILRGAPEAGAAEAYAVASFNLGRVMTSEGRVDEARESLQRALEVAEFRFGPDDGRTRMIRQAIEDLRRSPGPNSVVPGQPHEVVMRADGSSTHYRGLPDNDDLEEVIRLGEALRSSGVFSVNSPPPTVPAPVREDARTARSPAKRVPDFPPFRDGDD